MVVGQAMVMTVKLLQNILIVRGLYVEHRIYAEVLPTANDDAHEKYQNSVLCTIILDHNQDNLDNLSVIFHDYTSQNPRSKKSDLDIPSHGTTEPVQHSPHISTLTPPISSMIQATQGRAATEVHVCYHCSLAYSHHAKRTSLLLPKSRAPNSASITLAQM